jgi:flavin reductase (DIM6/NTAB) family NADH-FMN oxidoreductase RutF
MYCRFSLRSNLDFMNKEYSFDDLAGMEQRYRATFVNSLGGFKSLCLLGTKSEAGQSNLAVFSSFFHIGANPPLFGIIIRPDKVPRHTLDNILTTGAFTVNHVHTAFYTAAHQTSARYGAGQSEFSATGLTEWYKEDFHAPFVAESHIKIGAKFRERIDLAINGTVLIIGEMMYVSVPAEVVMNDGFIDLEKAGTLTCSGLDSYHTTTRISRLSYAKPDVKPSLLSVDGIKE